MNRSREMVSCGIVEDVFETGLASFVVYYEEILSYLYFSEPFRNIALPSILYSYTFIFKL